MEVTNVTNSLKQTFLTNTNRAFLRVKQSVQSSATVLHSREYSQKSSSLAICNRRLSAISVIKDRARTDLSFRLNLLTRRKSFKNA